LGLLGAGGTATALPILVYLVGLTPHHAITVSIVIVGTVSAFGAYLHHRHGTVSWPAVLTFAPFGVVGAALGAHWCNLVSGRALLLSFSLLLVIMAVRMLSDGGAAPPRRRAAPLVALAGFAIGILTGLLGVGGGFVIVPALIWLGGLEMKHAIGTSLAIIAINSASAFYGHWRATPHLDAPVVAALLLSAACGMAAGSRLVRRWPAARLRRGFAILLLLLAAYTAARTLLA
jgi:uncharacterized protein